jgi:hypothetical protein
MILKKEVLFIKTTANTSIIYLKIQIVKYYFFFFEYLKIYILNEKDFIT